MAVTLTGQDRTVHLGMAAEPLAEQVSGGVWRIGDTMPSGTDICTGQLAIGPGFSGQLDLSLVSPVGSTGNSSVKLFRRYLDRTGNLLSEVLSGALTIDSVGGTNTLVLPAAPAGTAQVEWGLQSNMAPAGSPSRFNEFPDPRCTGTVVPFLARNSWVLSNANDASGLPAGVTSYVQVMPNAAGSSSVNGFDLWQNASTSNPTAGVGMSVVPGQTITVSGYMYSSKASQIRVSMRFFSGTTWTQTITDSSLVTLNANTWTRVSLTVTVPAGAAFMVGRFTQNTSVTWALTDYIRLSGLLFEWGSTLGEYFDGSGQSSAIASPKSSRWDSTANASRSILYPVAIPGGTTIQATASLLTYSADAVEVVGVSLERDLRRSVADIWNSETALITAGTPGLLAGTLTLLCDSLAQALGVDSVYRMGGLVSLDSGDELDGLLHRAVGKNKIAPEKVLPGCTPKWTIAVEFREQAS